MPCSVSFLFAFVSCIKKKKLILLYLIVSSELKKKKRTTCLSAKNCGSLIVHLRLPAGTLHLDSLVKKQLWFKYIIHLLAFTGQRAFFIQQLLFY